MSLLTIAILGVMGLLAGMAIGRWSGSLHRRYHNSPHLLGLRLIAIYQLGVGLVAAILSVFVAYSVITRYDELHRHLAAFQIGPLQLLGEILAIVILALTAGSGLLFKTRWGWEIASFAITIAVARNLLSMLSSPQAIDRLDQTAFFFYTQHSSRAFLGGGLLAYLFRVRVMQYCGVDTNRRHHVKKLLGAVIVGFALQVLLGWHR